MSNQTIPNPWQAAMNPPQTAGKWYGQMAVNAWFCALIKGQGKVIWDPNQADPNTGNAPRRYTAIDLKLAPLYEKNAVNDLERTALAEFGDWPEIILPSLKDCGVTDLQSLNGRWVCVEMAENGTYQDKNTGETKKSTTFRFLQVFADEATCRAAWKADRGSDAPEAMAQPAPAAAPNGNGNKERETAVKFLKPYVTNAWRQSGGDLDKARGILAQLIAGQALLAKYFTVDSQEVLDELTTMATAIPA
ncbi:MAG: hypothetical protein ACOYYS_10140 [Chloroflexota bacterium]